MFKERRKLLSQNFLYDSRLINLLVRATSICSTDTVIEVGPGKGFITRVLLNLCKKLVVIELDEKLVLHLKNSFSSIENINILQGDFLKFELPKSSYKVFSNLPFSIEAKAVRKLLDAENPPDDAYLIVDKRFAARISGSPKESQLSLMYKPWFEYSILHRFKRTDFIPHPNIESVLLRIKKREQPLLSEINKKKWKSFIIVAFGTGLNISSNLLRSISRENLKKCSQNLNFSLKKKPGHLNLDQWLKLFNSLQN